MVATARCSRLFSIAIAVFAVHTNGAIDRKSKCFKIKNAIQYTPDGCIFVDHWPNVTMEEAEAACRNLSGDLDWNLPQFNFENARKWKAMSSGIAKLLSTKTAVFWIGLVRKNETWTWPMDDLSQDETKAMWKNGSERSESGDCALAEWDRQSGSMKWIGSACHNPSTVVSTLVCESISKVIQNATATNTTNAAPMSKNGSQVVQHELGVSTDDESAWDQYGRWILLGVCLVVIAALVVIGTVFYVRHRRRIYQENAKSRRDPVSSISQKLSISTKTDDSIAAFFSMSDASNVTETRTVGARELDTPKNSAVITRGKPAHKRKRAKRDNTDTSTDSEFGASSDTAMSES